MGLYTKIKKQRDNYYKAVSKNRSLSKQNFYKKNFSFIAFYFYCFCDC